MAERKITRREALRAAGALAGASVLTTFGVRLLSASVPNDTVEAAAGPRAPLRIGFQVHRTGIGAVYGRWYERVGNAALRLINEQGGIAGRPVQIIVEDDGTDPKRGVEVVEKFVNQHRVDFIFGTLFSHVVIAAAPRAGELKVPYLVVSEGYHVASGKLNRYVFQPGITDVRAQVTAVAPWIVKNLGKRATLIFPDYAFGHDHRDFFSARLRALGGEVAALVPIPPTETSFTRYFARVPRNTDFIYHVMVGPGVLTFVKELGEHFGARKPKLFGFIDSLEGVDIATPGLEYLEGSFLWEAFPRYAGNVKTAFEQQYRDRVGVDANGASKADPKDVSTYSHMFGVWETLFVIKRAVEESGYASRTPADYRKFITTLEGFTSFPESLQHPQGPKRFNGKLHQVFGHQFISQVRNKRLVVVHRTAIEDGLYPPEGDYTKMPL
ncbi:MAG: ABC transporter substrate-binding protein [Armatimonadota bacterium]|nr:ABC transporter substrate-binding protein [Armatimonadota bacterium]MDR7479093.1 ABC transporter substrate-binding protein [Armatimonadota bacterium]MDR7488982.1 ABC transporter substrate-binding protein [Armatimonadota bacterium]MDR7491119.1 ABC transporter substrate-binding protein [Armatimonadota bacterium]MDR7502904.1 ABC transporter substrate-binding protein [Armatimonadota bacterium]